jgi:hypothetical protein
VPSGPNPFERQTPRRWPGVSSITSAGELATFDRNSGADLVDAVTAGTALPGSSPTIRINGTHYINGGVRSSENTDLASGYADVVVLSPFGGRSATLPDGQFEGLRRPREWGMDLEGQVKALRKQGGRVEVITPDADSLAATSTNQVDPATRIPAARAGYAQGKHEATGVKFLCRLHGDNRGLRRYLPRAIDFGTQTVSLLMPVSGLLRFPGSHRGHLGSPTDSTT